MGGHSGPVSGGNGSTRIRFLKRENFFLIPGISKNRIGWPPKQI